MAKERYHYCETCEKSFHWLGIARHRAMHRDRNESCIIVNADGERWRYGYGDLKERGLKVLKLTRNYRLRKAEGAPIEGADFTDPHILFRALRWLWIGLAVLVVLVVAHWFIGVVAQAIGLALWTAQYGPVM